MKKTNLLLVINQLSKRVLPVILVLVLLVPIFNININARAASGVEGVEAFVSRMYTVILDRGSDKEGQKYWCEQLISLKATGISVAYGFISSPEFQNKKCTNEQYVKYMYKAFFGREADAAGLKYWVDLLNSGKTRDDVFAGFANSKEFEDLCSNNGIVRGYYINGFAPSQTAQVSLFVERLYNVILGRNCDSDGMAYWTTQLCTKAQSGSQAAGGFVFSQEFADKHLCDDHYLDVLYLAFMGRASDKDGKAYWQKQLDAGKSRETVFNGFASSAEFKGICESYGIESGTYKTSGKGTYRNGTCSVCGTHSEPPSNTEDDEAVKSGWITIDGYKFYYDAATKDYVHGLKQIGSSWYYFDDYGVMNISWVTIDGKKYYFGDDGKMRIGWCTIYDSKHYFNSDGSMYTGFLTENGKMYYFYEYGYMALGMRTIDGKKYYFDKSTGAAASGWIEYYSNWYYFDSKTHQAKTGWATIKNKEGVAVTYYFDSLGTMLTGEKEIDGKWYRFKDSGALVKGWYKDSSEKYYFYDRTTGAAVQKGWIKDTDGKWYYSKNAMGLMAKSEIVTTDKGASYVGSNYACAYGWIELSNGQWMYADKNGYLVTGIQTIGGKVYYFYDGTYKMATNLSYGGYYFDKDGYGTKK